MTEQEAAELAKYEYNDHGGAPFATHNFPCPICQKLPAVVLLWCHIFQPCWDCQRQGYITIKIKNRLQKYLLDKLGVKL